MRTSRAGARVGPHVLPAGPSPSPLGVDQQLTEHGVGDLALEGPDSLPLGLALFDPPFVVGPPSEFLWLIWQMAAMWIAWFSWRHPRWETRCTTFPPEESSIGAVPL